MRTRGRGQSPLLLLDVVDVLRAQTIDYAVIGAVAGSVHGVVRVSRDADVLLSTGALDGLKIERPFKEAGFSTVFNRGDLAPSHWRTNTSGATERRRRCNRTAQLITESELPSGPHASYGIARESQ